MLSRLSGRRRDLTSTARVLWAALCVVFCGCGYHHYAGPLKPVAQQGVDLTREWSAHLRVQIRTTPQVLNIDVYSIGVATSW